jgi:hypothetical protein
MSEDKTKNLDRSATKVNMLIRLTDVPNAGRSAFDLNEIRRDGNGEITLIYTMPQKTYELRQALWRAMHP